MPYRPPTLRVATSPPAACVGRCPCCPLLALAPPPAAGRCPLLMLPAAARCSRCPLVSQNLSLPISLSISPSSLAPILLPFPPSPFLSLHG
ncbi:hypothetical protein CLOP_g8702 [Closterium sp. NIES-67]|nr:hypothetical protein CLOP_g8702 [Closterium sp. NIES-67]